MGKGKIAGMWRAAQGCAPHQEVIRSLGLGSALCNSETQIECSSKSKAGVCQSATDLALLPLALPALGCQPSHRASLLICCQTTPSPVLGGIKGRGLLLHSSSSQTWLCCSKLTERSSLGTHSKWETPSAKTTPVPLSFTSIPLVCSRQPRNLCSSHGHPQHQRDGEISAVLLFCVGLAGCGD